MSKDKKIYFIFAGRLVKEKGFDLILGMFDEIAKDSNMKKKVHFDIFADGMYRERLEKGIKNGWDSFVTYHGQQPKKKVLSVWKKMHYALIPSRFLETFGLVGLDSLSVGVPVIGNGKGGLGQFILSGSQALCPLDPVGFFQHIKSTIIDFDEKERGKQSEEAKTLFARYTKKKRIERFQKLSGLEPGAKILLLSDYIVDVGGIESFLFNVKSLLEEHGYLVEMVGCKNKRLAYNRFVSMFGTFWNASGARLFKEKIHTFHPDLIWWHSVQRRFGPLVLYEARHCRAKQRVMYHDFGLFHPYPSRVYREEQIYRASTVRGYIGEGIFVKRWQAPLQLIKWMSSLLIKRQFKKIIDMHLVPSSYMENMVYTHYLGLKKEKIKTLSHFV